jgi:hypothetical protein
MALTLVLAASLLLAPQAFAQDDTSTEIEIVGLIETNSADTITVNNVIVYIADAEVSVDLSPGQAVYIEGNLIDGEVVAREVYAAETGLLPGEIEIRGQLQDYDDETITINGLVIDITGAEIDGELMPGDFVKVHATLSAEMGAVVTREVTTYEPGDDNTDDMDSDSMDDETLDDFKITGTLDEIGEDYIVVSGQTINGAGMEIEDQFVIGALVTVELHIAEGEWIAHEVDYDHMHTTDMYDDSDDASDDDMMDDDAVASSECYAEVDDHAVNLRRGPGLNYNITGTLSDDEQLPVVGRNTDQTGVVWYAVHADGWQQWVAGHVVEIGGACDNLTVVAAPMASTSSDDDMDDDSDDMYDDDSDDMHDDDSNDDMHDDNSNDMHDDDSNDDMHDDDSNDDMHDDDSNDDMHDDDSNDDMHDESDDNDD